MGCSSIRNDGHDHDHGTEKTRADQGTRANHSSKETATTVAEQIETAVRKGRNGGLITFDDLPQPWKINPFILSGYQFSNSVHQCARNAFSLSNETFNIWSHVFGLVYAVYLLTTHCMKQQQQQQQDAPFHSGQHEQSRLIGLIYLAVATVCFGGSIAWHSMKCISCPHTLMRCASCDLMGITAMISTIAMLTVSTAFQCQPRALQLLYACPVAISASACLAMTWQTGFRAPQFAWLRATMFTLLGTTGLLPFLHLTFFAADSTADGLSHAVRFYHPLFVDMCVPAFFGALVYASKMPERAWPGRFDLLGSSHNVWHVAVLVLVLRGHDAMQKLLEIGAAEALRKGACLS